MQVVIFVLIPFVLGSLTRWWLLRGRTPAEGERRISRVEDFFSPITMIGEHRSRREPHSPKPCPIGA
jgi:ACR3 family arsenite efflux pump ArsB